VLALNNSPIGKVKLPPVDQIGIVVNDMDEAIEYYSSVFGLGPFSVIEFDIEDFTYRGQKGNCRMKLGFAESGSIEIELVQIVEGETPHTEFLRAKGEGVQHLRFHVDDLDGTLDELAKKGIEPVLYKHYKDYGIKFAFINSDKIGGITFELIEENSEHTSELIEERIKEQYA
jgi:methylmalonyl-CoA/ethylmalonyl-CoA epimerase